MDLVVVFFLVLFLAAIVLPQPAERRDNCTLWFVKTSEFAPIHSPEFCFAWFQKFMGFQVIELVISFVAIVAVVYVAYAMSKVKKRKKSQN